MSSLDNKRRNFLKALGIGTLSMAFSKRIFSGTRKKPFKRPNVILIITDDQGYGDFSCHGNPVLKTPHLDRLYSQSVRLTNFHVDPTCAPTRSSLLTGRYSSRTGVWHTIMGRSLLRKDETTLADIFSYHGYQTGIFGKWHLGDNFPYRPQDRGFKESVVIGGGAIGNTPDYWGNDYFDDTYTHNSRLEKYKGYCTDVFFDEALKFIRKNRHHPFFCYLSTNTPHYPHNVSEKYSQPYQGKVPDIRATFYGMISNIDENMGVLIKELKSLRLEENTILVFLTDNGTSFGVDLDRQGFPVDGFNAGMRGKKGSIYEGGHRVPCFIRWPGSGIEGGRDIRQLSAHIDILPTLLDLCEISMPSSIQIDGNSLKPLLEGKESPWMNRVLLVHNQRVDLPIKGRRYNVMTDQWRLLNGTELYDIQKDPGQRQNIASRYPDKVHELKRFYEVWWDDISKRFDEYTYILLGRNKNNPVKLASHDLHGQVGWDQVHVRRNSPCHGYWAVEFARDGLYEVSVRRWPREARLALEEAPPEAEVFKPTQARLKVADVDESKKIPKGVEEVNFRVPLKAGKTRLQAWLIDGRENGLVNTAFYVYVTLIK